MINVLLQQTRPRLIFTIFADQQVRLACGWPTRSLMTYSCCSINQFARDVRSIGYLLCCTYYQHMIVINSMAESTTLGEIDIHMLHARNEAVDRGKGTYSLAPYHRMHSTLQKHRQMACRRAFSAANGVDVR